jgi:SAM-dependent methyltransferase
VGVDISEKAVATACASGVRAIAGNPDTGEGLDRLGTGFDVVTALDVLEHTVHPREVLRRMQSLVSPDGCLILSVPNAGCLPARIVLALGLAPKRDSGLFDAGHLHWFTRASLGKLATECGWRPVAWRATPLPAVSRLGLWRTERLQLALLRPLANRWPGAWAYQLIVRLDRTT